jgi:hypothetical protein
MIEGVAIKNWLGSWGLAILLVLIATALLCGTYGLLGILATG